MWEAWIDRLRWPLCALSGLLLALSFAPFSQAGLGWVALAPAWWAATRSPAVRRRPLRYGYLLGLVYFGGSFWWIGDVTVIGTALLILYLALYPAMWFLLLARLPGVRGTRQGLAVLLQAGGAAALWVTLEWWRGWFLSGFDWNQLGVSQASSLIVRQLAAYGGVPLISFVLVLGNVLWAEAVPGVLGMARDWRSMRVPLALRAAVWLLAASFALGFYHFLRHRHDMPAASLRFACVQPNIPQIPYGGGPWTEYEQRERDALQVEIKLTQLALTRRPDLLLWPEAVTNQAVFQDREMNVAVGDICRGFDGAFLLGSEDYDARERKLYNCAYFFVHRGDLFDVYRKNHLVLLGEYLPFGDQLPWLRRAIGMGLDFSPGRGPKKFTLEHPAASFSPLICFEDTLADVANRAAKLDPDFFVTITNDGWYTGTCARWGIPQHLAQAVFRCVEHDRPMLRCTNNGISTVIDQDGGVAHRYRDPSGRETDVGGIFSGVLWFYPHRPTFYEAAGDWIVLISEGVTVMLGVPFLVRPRASRES